jgi:hypothetical protein
MARAVDGFKRQVWSQRLRRFEQGPWTVAAFCRKEGVSVPSFYHWKKILGSATGYSASRSTHEPRELARPRSLNRESFVPLEIVSSAAIEMCLTNGVRLTIPAGDPAALAAAIAAAGCLPSRFTTEDESC